MSSGADRCARKDCQGLRMAHGHGFHDFVEPAPQSETREEWQARRDQREVDARLGMLRASQSCTTRSGSGEPTDICARPKCLSPRSYNIHDPERGGHVFVEPPQSCPASSGSGDVEPGNGFCGRCLDVARCNRIGHCVDHGEGDGDEAGRLRPDPDAAVRAKLDDEANARRVAREFLNRTFGGSSQTAIAKSMENWLTTAMVSLCEDAFAAGRALGRVEGAREASAGCYCKTHQFKVMDAPTGCPQLVPWWLLAPFEPQALKNHDQTLELLNERGGLAPCEMLAVIEGRRWRKMDDAEAGRQLAKVVADAIARRGKESK